MTSRVLLSKEGLSAPQKEPELDQFWTKIIDHLNSKEFVQAGDKLYLARFMLSQQTDVFPRVYETIFEKDCEKNTLIKGSLLAQMLASHDLSTDFIQACNAGCLIKLTNFDDAEKILDSNQRLKDVATKMADHYSLNGMKQMEKVMVAVRDYKPRLKAPPFDFSKLEQKV